MKLPLLLIYIVLFPALLHAATDDNLAAQLRPLTPEEIKQTGNDYARKEQWGQALYCYQTIIAGAQRADASLHATAWNNLGYVYFYGRADYAQAFQCFMQSQAIAEEAHDHKMMPYVDLNLANVYALYKDDENALTHYKRAFQAATREEIYDVALTSILGLAINTMENRTTKDVREEVALFKQTQWPEETPGLKNARIVVEAYTALDRGDTPEAIRLLERVDTRGTETLTPERLMAQCTLLRAALYQRQGQLQQARDLLRTAVGDSLPADLKVDFLEVESDILAAMGYADSAFATHCEALRISDSLYRRQRYAHIRDLRSDYEMRQAATQIQQADARRQAAWRWAMLALAVALVIGALSLVLVAKNRKLRQKNEALYQKTRDDIVQHEAKPHDLDEALLARVGEAMSDASLITTEDFTIDRLARALGSNTTYVSRVINAGTGKNFAALLGEARVRLACQRLTDPAYARYTVEGIAQDLGFRSRTNFIAVFKRTTGLTPSEYKRIGGA